MAVLSCTVCSAVQLHVVDFPLSQHMKYTAVSFGKIGATRESQGVHVLARQMFGRSGSPSASLSVACKVVQSKVGAVQKPPVTPLAVQKVVGIQDKSGWLRTSTTEKHASVCRKRLP